MSWPLLILSLILLTAQVYCQTVKNNTRGVQSLSLSVLPKGNALSDVLRINFTFVPWEDLKAWKIKLDFDTNSVPTSAESANSSLTALSGGVFVLHTSSSDGVVPKNKTARANVSFISTRKNLKLPANLIFMTVNSAGQPFYQTFKNDGTLLSVSNTTTSVFDVDLSNPQETTPAQLVSELSSTPKVEKNKLTLKLVFKFKQELTLFNINFPQNTAISSVNATGAVAVTSRGLLTISYTEKVPMAKDLTIEISAQLSDSTKAPQGYTLTSRVRNYTQTTNFRVSYGVSSALPKDSTPSTNGNLTLFNFTFTANTNLTAWRIAFRLVGDFLNASSNSAQLIRGSEGVYLLDNDAMETVSQGKTRTVSLYVSRSSPRAKVEITSFEIMTKDSSATAFYQSFGRTGLTLSTFDSTSLFINSNKTDTQSAFSELVSSSNVLNEVRTLGDFYLTINLTPRKNWDTWAISFPKTVTQVKPSPLFTVLNSEGNMTLYSTQKAAANKTFTVTIEGQLTRSEDSPSSVIFKANIGGDLFSAPLTLTRKGFQNGQMSFTDRFPNYAIDFILTPWEDITSWVLRFRFAGEFAKISTEDFRVEWRNDDAYILFPTTQTLTKGKNYDFALLYTLAAGQKKTVAPRDFSVMTVNTQGETYIQTFNAMGRMVNPNLQPSAFNSTAPTTNNSIPSQVMDNFSPSVSVNSTRPKFVFNFAHNNTWKGFFLKFINSENSYITQVFGNCCTIVEDANSQVSVYSNKDFTPGSVGLTLQGTLKSTSLSGMGKTPSRLFFGANVAGKQLTTYLELPIKEANASSPTRRIVVQITLRGSKTSFKSSDFVKALVKIFKLKSTDVRVVSFGKRGLEMVEQDTTTTFPVITEFSGNAADSAVQNLTNMINNNDTTLNKNGIDATSIKVIDNGSDAPTGAPSTQNNDNSLSTGAIVGIVIGCIAFVVIVIVILAIILKPKSSGPKGENPILY